MFRRWKYWKKYGIRVNKKNRNIIYINADNYRADKLFNSPHLMEFKPARLADRLAKAVRNRSQLEVRKERIRELTKFSNKYSSRKNINVYAIDLSTVQYLWLGI